MGMCTAARSQWIGVVCVNIATLAWATNMVLGRMMKDSIGPIALSGLRFFIAGIIFAVLLRREPPDQRKPHSWKGLLAMAVTGVVIFSPLLYWGLHYTTAVNCTLINSLTPLCTAVLAAWLLREPISTGQVGGSLVALAGVLFLVSGGSWEFWHQAHWNKGDLLVLASLMIWSVYAIIGSQVMRYQSPIGTTAFSIFAGLPLLLLLTIWELQRTPIDWNMNLGMMIVYIAIVPTTIGFYAWNEGVARLGAGRAAIFYNTLPLYGAIMGAVFLQEKIGWPHIIGGLMIIGGGLWAAAVRIRHTQAKPSKAEEKG